MEGALRKIKVTIELEIEEFNYDTGDDLIQEINEYLQLPEGIPFTYDDENFEREFTINSVIIELSPEERG